LYVFEAGVDVRGNFSFFTRRYKNPNGTITSLNFSPTDNCITYTTISGHFITWNEPIPADHPHPAKAGQKRAPRGADTTDALFDDEEGEGEDLAELEDDWIEDDVGDGNGMKYGERERSVGFGAKEVGKLLISDSRMCSY
jgi:hypothetical protein